MGCEDGWVEGVGKDDEKFAGWERRGGVRGSGRVKWVKWVERAGVVIRESWVGGMVVEMAIVNGGTGLYGGNCFESYGALVVESG